MPFTGYSMGQMWLVSISLPTTVRQLQ